MNNLERIRTAREMTQETLALSAGIAVSTYSMYANGHRTIPRAIAENIASALDCKIEDIFSPEKFTVSKNPSEELCGLTQPVQKEPQAAHNTTS